MNWLKLAGYGIVALIGLFIAKVVVGIVTGIIGFMWSLLWTFITIGIPLIVGAAVVYGAYKLYGMVSGSSTQTQSDSLWEEETQKGKSAQGKYADGEISEDQLEKQLEREMR